MSGGGLVVNNIKRDNLGMPVYFIVYDKFGQTLNLINNKLTPIHIGDQYQHDKLGVGMIHFISSNGKTKYPIKIHFKDFHCYAWFNVDGMQYDKQEVPLIDFPMFYGTCYPAEYKKDSWDTNWVPKITSKERLIELAEELLKELKNV